MVLHFCASDNGRTREVVSMMKRFLFFTALLAVSGTVASAQAPVTIAGRVTSDAGVPLAGASVFIPGMNLGASTSDDGSYTFVVPASRATGGTATLTARVIGYSASSVPITLTPGTTVQRSFQLTVNP